MSNMKAKIIGPKNECEYSVEFSDGRVPSWMFTYPTIVKQYKFYYVSVRTIQSFYYGDTYSGVRYRNQAYIPITQELIGDCKRVLSYDTSPRTLTQVQRNEEMIAFVNALEELLNA